MAMKFFEATKRVMYMDDLKQAVSALTKNFTKTSSGLIKNTKLNIQLISEEDKLKSIYVEIGKKVHEIYAYGGTLGGFFDGYYTKLTEAQNKVDAIKNQLVKNKETSPPAALPARLPPPESQKSPEPLESPEQLAPAPLAEKAVEMHNGALDESVAWVESTVSMKMCGVCGAQSDMGEKFCLSCGRML